MECVSLLGKCRACRIKTQKEFQHHIFTTENLQQIFHEATSLEIHENDGLPGILCDDCHSRLIDAFKFRQMCASSAQIFQEILSVKDDSDNEQKYVIPDEEASEHKISYRDDEFIPIESLVEAQFNDTPKHPKKEAIRKSLRKSLHNLNSLKADPDWDTQNTKRRKKKPAIVPKIPRVKKLPEDAKVSGDVKNVPEGGLRGRKAEFVCSMCGKKYVKKVTLEAHIRFVHQGLKDAECAICHKHFTRPINVLGHMVRMHGSKEMIRCKECGKVYRTPEGLGNHMKEWHDPENPKQKPRNSMCDLCGKAFTSPAALRKHANFHAGIRPHKCTICSRRYPTKHHLKVHMMRHEGIKNHVCTVCGLQKITADELKTHMNVHTQEKIYSCEQCPKTFNSTGNYKRHVKIVHQRLKAFPCPHCERSFGKKETLKHHIMTHTGEKPHACELCGKRFIQPTALQTHIKMHMKYI